MSEPLSIEEHPQLAEIQAAIDRGESYDRIRRMYAVSRRSLVRYATKYLASGKPRPQRAPADAPAAVGVTPDHALDTRVVRDMTPVLCDSVGPAPHDRPSTPDLTGSVGDGLDDPMMGEAIVQEHYQRQARSCWHGMDARNRERYLVWLQEQLQAQQVGVSEWA